MKMARYCYRCVALRIEQGPHFIMPKLVVYSVHRCLHIRRWKKDYFRYRYNYPGPINLYGDSSGEKYITA